VGQAIDGRAPAAGGDEIFNGRYLSARRCNAADNKEAGEPFSISIRPRQRLAHYLETVGQLNDQLRAERARNAEANLNIAQLRQELAAVRYELAKRDTIEAFRALPCGSTVH
jgi:hypothetical protein